MPVTHLALALSVVAVWGTNFVVIKWGLAELPPFLLATLRFALSSLPFLLFLRPPATGGGGLAEQPIYQADVGMRTGRFAQAEQMAERVMELGRRARVTSDGYERAALYGEFLNSCATCHTANPKNAGKTRAGKLVEPLAPGANPQRFTDAAKTEKWFGRNCRDVLERACTAQEKGDFITYLQSIK